MHIRILHINTEYVSLFYLTQSYHNLRRERSSTLGLCMRGHSKAFKIAYTREPFDKKRTDALLVLSASYRITIFLIEQGGDVHHYDNVSIKRAMADGNVPVLSTLLTFGSYPDSILDFWGVGGYCDNIRSLRYAMRSEDRFVWNSWTPPQAEPVQKPPHKSDLSRLINYCINK